MEKKNALVVKPQAEIKKQEDGSALLRLAIDKNLDVDKLSQLIDLRVAEDQRRAKQEFDEHFAAMQAEYVPAEKTKSVMNRAGTQKLYAYAPLESILKVYQPIINRNGFSYRWSEETISDGKEKRVWCIVSGWGHEVRNYVDIPIMPGSDFTNSVQQRGVSATYGKRYSFCDAFGIILAGEDDDARSIKEPVREPVRATKEAPLKQTPEKEKPKEPSGYSMAMHLLQAKTATGKNALSFEEMKETKRKIDAVRENPAELKQAIDDLEKIVKERGGKA